MTLEKNDLIKDNGTKKNTVVFGGNGAIKNGWNPLRSLLDRWINGDKSISPLVTALRSQNSEAFHQLAILSYKFKVARAHEFVAWKNGIHTPLETEKNGFSNLVPGFLELRDGIAAEYSKQGSQLFLRRSSAIDKLIGEDAAFITTNWDETLWNDGNIENVIQLHGRCRYGHSLVFPTELLIEDTAYDLIPFFPEIEKCEALFQEQIFSAFRYRSMSALFGAHVTSTEWLKQCERLIIWGYSLGDYDADINGLIGTYIPSSVKEIIIINPDPATFKRAVALTGVTNAIHFDPITEVSMKFL